MYQLPRKIKGSVLTADNWNNSVEAIQDALNRTSDFNSMLPSVPSSGRWAGGRYVDDKGGFSLRSLTKTGEAWTAYFNPGRVLEVHAGHYSQDWRRQNDHYPLSVPQGGKG